ncbi:MAG: PAS domain S-box protein [Campylobacterales bacterium]|nr:PAS domain S-box protein [Campylobacterales bacterium]
MSTIESKLKESNEKLRAIIDSSWDPIGIINENSTFIYVNKAFSPILGYKKEELLGLDFTSILKNNGADLFNSLIKNYEEKSYKDHLTLLCLRKDKQEVYLQIILTKMSNSDFYIINATDVTKELSKDFIIDSYVLSLELNDNHIITQCSSAFAYLSAYNKEELISKPLDIVLHEEEKSTFDEKWQKIKENKEYSTAFTFEKKDKNKFTVQTQSKMQLNKYGDIVGYTLLFFDTSNENKLKSKILIEQSKLAIMSETIQMISHEWRQPLNSISLTAQTMDYELELNTMETSEIRQRLTLIKEKVDDLSLTIENFQDLISLKSFEEKTSAKELISISLEQIKNSTVFKDINIKLDLSSDLTFLTYKKEFIRILLNLLINSSEAFIKNNVKNKEILLKEYLINDKICFEISDNAGGIDSSIIEKVFHPYFSTKEQKHGVGLGLYNCKIIIQMHLKGSIKITNENNGIKVKIKLPIKHI